MTAPRLATLRPAFVPEWCAIAVMALAELVWARAVGLQLTIGAGAFLLPPALFAGFTLPRALRAERFALFCEYCALSLLGSFALVVLSYLCMASAGPLADSTLLAFDRALGFDWLAIWRLISPHPALMRAMAWSYDSLVIQSLTVTILLGLLGEAREMRDLWRLSTIGCALSCLTAILLPALGPYKIFGLDAQGPFLPAMEQLMARHDLHFDAATLRGVIEFPSVHTVLALACSWAMRRTGPLFWVFVALNGTMLFTIPFMGGHYLADIFGGVGVFAGSLWIVRRLNRNAAKRPIPETGETPASPVPAPC